ncbi:MAG: hypothetical protein DYG92_08460 [Leptolyngbya sp. PLA1]|nr:hypothetical protein [Leptolyngbya sp. PLA1]
MRGAAHGFAMVGLAITAAHANAQWQWTGAAGNHQFCDAGNWQPQSVPTGGSATIQGATSVVRQTSGCQPQISLASLIADSSLELWVGLVAGNAEMSNGSIDIGGADVQVGGVGLVMRGDSAWRSGNIQCPLFVESGQLSLTNSARGTRSLRSGGMLRVGSGAAAVSSAPVTVYPGGEALISGDWTWTTVNSGASAGSGSGAPPLVSIQGGGRLVIDLPGTVAAPTNVSHEFLPGSRLDVLRGGVTFSGFVDFAFSVVEVDSAASCTFLIPPLFEGPCAFNGGGTAKFENGTVVVAGGAVLTSAMIPGGPGDKGLWIDPGSSSVDIGGRLENDGTITWSDGSIGSSAAGAPQTRLINRGEIIYSSFNGTLGGMNAENQGRFLLKRGLFLDGSLLNSGEVNLDCADSPNLFTHNQSTGSILNSGTISSLGPNTARIEVPIIMQAGGILDVGNSVLTLQSSSFTCTGTSSSHLRSGSVLSIATGFAWSGAAGIHSLDGPGRLVSSGNLSLQPGFVLSSTLPAVDGFTLESGWLRGGGQLINHANMRVSLADVGTPGGSQDGTLVTNHSYLAVTNGLRLGGILSSDGVVDVRGSVAMGTAAVFDSSGTVYLASNSGVTKHTPSASPTGIINTGLIRKTAGGGSTIAVPLDNRGVVEAFDGSLSISGQIAQLVGDRLTGGTWATANTGTLSLGGRLVRSTAPGTTVRINNIDVGAESFPDFRPENLQGDTIIDGVQLIQPDLLLDAPVPTSPLGYEPVFEIGAGGRVRFPPGTPDGGVVRVGSDSQRNLPGGHRVRWSGTPGRLGVRQNNGVFRPGNSPGIAIIEKDYQLLGGELEIELGGSEPGTGYDRVQVGGVASLGGTLRVVPFQGFVPDNGQEFDILTASAINGSFQTVLADGLGDVRVQYLPDRVRISFHTCAPDFNQDGNTDQDDLAYLIDVLAGGDNPSGRDPDFNADGNADQDDTLALLDVLAGGACP